MFILVLIGVLHVLRLFINMFTIAVSFDSCVFDEHVHVNTLAH